MRVANRVDSMPHPGGTVPPYYDSLLAKLIMRDENGEAALARALDEVELESVHSTLALHRALLNDADVSTVRCHTNTIEAWMQAEREAQQ